jgi:hypothetical protein
VSQDAAELRAPATNDAGQRFGCAPGQQSRSSRPSQHHPSPSLPCRSASAASDLGRSFGRPPRQQSRRFGPAQQQSSSSLCGRSGLPRGEPGRLFCPVTAARPTTAHERNSETQPGEDGKAKRAFDEQVRTVVAGSLAATGSETGKRWMTAGPGCVTDTPRSKPTRELSVRHERAAVPDDSLCRSVRGRRVKDLRLEGRNSKHDGRDAQGHH